MKKRQLVYVVWTDAVANAGWFGEDELQKWIDNLTMKCIDVGWLIKKTKKYIVLASRYSVDDKQYGQVHKIPIAWVRVYPIKEPIKRDNLCLST